MFISLQALAIYGGGRRYQAEGYAEVRALAITTLPRVAIQTAFIIRVGLQKRSAFLPPIINDRYIAPCIWFLIDHEQQRIGHFLAFRANYLCVSAYYTVR
jgi:hypothetical protein